MMNGQYKIALVDDEYILKLVGEVRYTNTPILNNFIKQLSDSENKKDIIIDLSEAQYLDSTNLGLIARIASYCLSNFHHKLTVITTDDNITTLLNNVGFDNICQFIHSPIEYIDEIMELKKVNNDQLPELAEIMYQAHKTLANLNEKNRIEFQNAVDLLKNEVSVEDQ